MELVAQLFINTLQIGVVYVLFSLGFTIIFGVMKIVNFAHGEFFALAALLMAFLVNTAAGEFGLPLWVGYAGGFFGRSWRYSYLGWWFIAPYLNVICATSSAHSLCR